MDSARDLLTPAAISLQALLPGRCFLDVKLYVTTPLRKLPRRTMTQGLLFDLVSSFHVITSRDAFRLTLFLQQDPTIGLAYPAFRQVTAGIDISGNIDEGGKHEGRPSKIAYTAKSITSVLLDLASSNQPFVYCIVLPSCAMK
jgi:hypothetical protein